MLVPYPSNVIFAMLKSMQTIGATWIKFGIRSNIDIIFLSKFIGPAKLQFWIISSLLFDNNFDSIFIYLLYTLFSSIFFLFFDLSSS